MNEIESNEPATQLFYLCPGENSKFNVLYDFYILHFYTFVICISIFLQSNVFPYLFRVGYELLLNEQQ